LNIPGYEIIKQIGCGGMGEVYLARQLSLGRLVAIKILAIVPEADTAQMAVRFHREAQLMARVHHPNVLSVHDFGIIGSRPYLIMEYIEGGDLRRWMKPGQPLPVDQVRSLVMPVTQALACLHGHGILHRDLKPENILMATESTPKVSDFGLAVLGSDIGTLTRTDQALGTIGYVAPEQQYRLKVDERSDQYSMAALMYEMLTGRRPLGILKPPSDLNPELGSGVDAVLLRALREDPDERYSSVLEFGEAMEKSLANPSLRSRLSPIKLLWTINAVVALGIGAAWFWAKSVRPANSLSSAGLTARPSQPAQNSPGPVRLTNSVGMTLVRIPAGEFLMGSPDSDPVARSDEKPRHLVRISSPFYLGAHEVTVGQFRAFVAATGYRTEAESSGQGGCVYSRKAKYFEWDPKYTWRNPGLPVRQGDDEPVVQVSWNDAMAFCGWLSDLEGRPCRLPTEAEWEHACRAGSTTRWHMGDDPTMLGRFAWVWDQAESSTHPVGRKEPNAFGLYDMHGNVWEWCLDNYGPYWDGPVLDPSGAPGGRMRVLRGGASSRGELDRTSSAARLSRDPSFRYYRYGFRVCCPVPEQEGEE
jgi:eukaryotic-like serine/threonine-protein kinase